MASIDVISMAIANKYTDDSIEGGGVVRGKNCTISSIDVITGGHRVTFKWYLDNGTEQTDYMDVMDGAKGEDGEKGEAGEQGRGIKHSYVNQQNHFIIVYDDDVEEDMGEITVLCVDTLNELNDVEIDEPTDGQVLKYNAETEKWENGTGGGGGSYTAGDGISIENDEISIDPMPAEDVDEVIDIYPTAGNLVSIVNAFNRGDLYDTSEKMIGKWIDNKPLYQKTIDFGALPNNNTKDVSHGISNIEKIINLFGTAITSTNGFTNLLALNVPSNPSSGWFFGADATVIRCSTNSDRSSYDTCYVTLQYTKTTDSAISIGSDTDYSTEEKIVGTWIDGKPIYQKTSSVTITAKNTNIYVNDITGIDKAVSVDGVLYISDADQVLLNHYVEGTDFVSFYNGKFFVHSANWDNRVGKTAIITARYIKATT